MRLLISYIPGKRGQSRKRLKQHKRHSVRLAPQRLLLPQIDVLTETCKRCGYMSSNELCKACTLLEGLERGVTDAGVVCAFARVFILVIGTGCRPNVE